MRILSGEKLDQYLRNRIFVPLDMTDTWFYLPGRKQSRLVMLTLKMLTVL